MHTDHSIRLLSPVSPSTLQSFHDRIYNLSLVRMLAMFSILLCHIVQYYGNELLAVWLNLGVDVFLILSGYLYGMRSFRFDSNKDRLRFAMRFYAKEFLKLLLPYYVMLAVAMPIYYMVGKASLPQIGLALLLVNKGIPGLGHLWFFRFIIICYLGTPFWYFIPERRWKNMFLLLVFLIMVPLSGTGIIWVACYVLGILLARLRHFACGHPSAPSIVRWSVITAGCLLTACCILRNVDRTEYDLLLNTQKMFLGGAVFIVLTTLFKQESFGAVMRKILKLSDAISYEFFLVHPLFLTGAFRIMIASDSRLNAMLLFAVCCTLSSYFLHMASIPLKNCCFRFLKT